LRANYPADQIVNGLRQNHPSGFTIFLQSGRDIDTVTIDVVCCRHHVTDVNRNAQSDWAQLDTFRCPHSMYLFLDLTSPFHRVESTRELREDPVSGRFDHPSAMFLRARTNDVGEQRHPAPVGAGLVLGHQSRIADDIRKCDCG
jgi:hypothetical protein